MVEQHRSHACAAPVAASSVQCASGCDRQHQRRFRWLVGGRGRSGARSQNGAWLRNAIASAASRRVRTQDHPVHVGAAGSGDLSLNVNWEVAANLAYLVSILLATMNSWHTWWTG